MLVRQCDRCATPALDPKTFELPKSVVVPQSDPSTLPATGDVAFNVALSLTQDVCPICCASVLIEYANALLGVSVLVGPVRTLSNAITKQAAGTVVVKPS